MTSATYLGLLAVSAVLAVTPGPDTMLSLRCALSSRRAGIGAATGSSAAAFLWAALAATGLAMLLETLPQAYELLSVVGGLYLLALGAYTITTARRRLRAVSTLQVPALVGSRTDATGSAEFPDSPTGRVGADGGDALGTRVPRATGRSGLIAGLITCMTNPKVGLFFLALFPQFTPPEASLAFTVGVLGGTVAVTMYLYLLGVVLLVDAANRWLSNPRVTGWVESSSGAVLVLLGSLMVITGLLGLIRLGG